MGRNPFIIMAAIIGMALLLGGCWDSRELDEIGLVSGVGVDQSVVGQNYALTVEVIQPGQVRGPGSNGGASGGGSPSVLIQSRGETAFDAVRNASFKNGRRLHFTHSEVLIIGRQTAQNGLGDILDFFIRDPEPRPTLMVLVADGKAGEVLKAKPVLEKVTSMMIQGILDNAGATSKMRRVTLQDFVGTLISKSRSGTAPIIKVSGKGSAKKLVIDGMAVFKGDRMVGRLIPKDTRGMLWVTGEVQSGIVVVKPKEDERVSLEIITASGRFRPQMKAGQMLVRVEIQVVGNLGAQADQEDWSEPAKLRNLEKRMETIIQWEVREAVKKAAELKADIFGFGESIARKYPKEWKSMEPRWDELFPRVKVQVVVDAQLRLVGKTISPPRRL